MARGGINKALVLKAKQALQARGARPTIDAVRTELGNTGSKSTIHRYLQELARLPEAPPPSLSEELGSLIAHVADRLVLEAEAKVSTAREAVARQHNENLTQRRYSEERIQDLQAGNMRLTEQLNECQQDLEQLRERYQTSEFGRGQAERSLEERANQLRSLEDKHQMARQALEHYREARKEQREQEHQHHDAQVQQLQAELRQLRQSLLSKQDELSTLNRDNERLLVEARNLVKHQSAIESELAIQRSALQTLRQELTVRSTEKAALEERLKQHNVERLRLKHQVQQQARQLEVLQDRLVTLAAVAPPPEVVPLPSPAR
ncbi:cointegrate resolution protein T [Pseudomonas sp. BN417]|uniref:DNA-binding protein n=1 Tax=Pseudomonas sp. BN417 TaxID=2567890 RepID=UPI00245482D0|nr:DNA-binding protein [Pseudomonas sp. BN417]MDH4556960.1 cointegrate resolution protein T [Pseudomonas sp. BN417]